MGGAVSVSNIEYGTRDCHECSIDNSIFHGNRGHGNRGGCEGSAIVLQSGSLNTTNTTFRFNGGERNDDQVIFARQDTAGAIVVKSCSFANNSGCAIARASRQDTAGVTVVNTSFTHNAAGALSQGSGIVSIREYFCCQWGTGV
jgi:hypothetical protein